MRKAFSNLWMPALVVGAIIVVIHGDPRGVALLRLAVWVAMVGMSLFYLAKTARAENEQEWFRHSVIGLLFAIWACVI